jgi:uncharacterized protein
LIYLDSCLVIYLVQRHPLWWARVDQEIAALASTQFAISYLVVGECLVLPFKTKDQALQRSFDGAFGRFVRLDMPEAVYVEAARLRARFSIKLPDALHLACAQHHGCAGLWTADTRLSAAGGKLVRVLAP